MKNLKCLFREVFGEGIGEARVIWHETPRPPESAIDNAVTDAARSRGNIDMTGILEQALSGASDAVAAGKVADKPVAKLAEKSKKPAEQQKTPAEITAPSKEEIAKSMTELKTAAKQVLADILANSAQVGDKRMPVWAEANTTVDNAKDTAAIKATVIKFQTYCGGPDTNKTNFDAYLAAHGRAYKLMERVPKPAQAVATMEQKNDLNEPPLAMTADKFPKLPTGRETAGKSNAEILAAITKGARVTVEGVKIALNFRASPGGDIQGKLQKGTEVKFASINVVSQGGKDWVNVTADGKPGWVALSYLKISTERPEDVKAHAIVEKWKREAADKKPNV